MSATNRGGEREPLDYYPTPDYCTESILLAASRGWGRLGSIRGSNWLEPSSGDGAIIRAASRIAPHVEWTAVEIDSARADLCRATCAVRVLCCDFLDYPVSHDCIVGNPPYRIAAPFIEHALELSPHVLYLLRLPFIASQEREALFHDRMPDIYVLPRRPSMNGTGSDMTEYAWFHWHPWSGDSGLIRRLPLADCF